MSNLEEFLNNKLPEDQDDLFMDKIAKLRMQGMKKDYEQKLRTSYGVSKERYKSKKNWRIGLIGLMAVVLLGLIYLFLATNVFTQKEEDHSRLIASYIEDNKIHNFDITRGAAGDKAHNAYQLGNYKEAIDSWQSGKMNLQDSFYLAMSNFYIEDYLTANINFQTLNEVLSEGDKFHPESQLYQALSLKMLNNDEGANRIYESWTEDSWMTREYRKIFKN